MSKFNQTSKILELMKNKENIRNIGMIAHIDHGKTTTTDLLLAEAGLLPSKIAGSAKALDYLPEEQKRGITIKTSNISLLHKVNDRPYVINLVDTPGHVDFTGKVTRALRTIDGAIVVVDAIEGVMSQTETVTKQAIEENVRPLLFINKVDRLINELKFSPTEIQRKFSKIINDFNSIIENYTDSSFKRKWKVSLNNDTVVFGSALHNWGFNLETFKSTKVTFKKILEAYKNNNVQKVSTAIPLSSSLLRMIVKNISNPKVAQRYRVPKIWKGDITSKVGQAILNCDTNGPAVVFVTDIKIDNSGKPVLIGRIFSGSIKNGDHLYLIKTRRTLTANQIFMYMGSFREPVAKLTAGNIISISGADVVNSNETVISIEYKDKITPFENITYVSEPVITVAIESKNLQDLQQLAKNINNFLIEDPNLSFRTDKNTGQFLLSGMGELHLEITLNSLSEKQNIPLIISDPIVSYRESISKPGPVVMVKTSDKNNKFWIKVEPVEAKVLDLMERGKLTEDMNIQEACTTLKNNADYQSEAETILAINKNKNLILNYAGELPSELLSEGIISGFNWVCNMGPLCGEPFRGLKVKLIKVQINKDLDKLILPQVMRAISRAILGSSLKANPHLLEPLYKLELSSPNRYLGNCLKIINRRRGKVELTQNKGDNTVITANIPVAETLGLSDELRSLTSGYAFWQFFFNKWEIIPKHIENDLIQKIRIKRGLQPEIPKAEKFIDKIFEGENL